MFILFYYILFRGTKEQGTYGSPATPPFNYVSLFGNIIIYYKKTSHKREGSQGNRRFPAHKVPLKRI